MDVGEDTGSSTSMGHQKRLALNQNPTKNLQGVAIIKIIQPDFKATNNQTKHEAVLTKI